MSSFPSLFARYLLCAHLLLTKRDFLTFKYTCINVSFKYDLATDPRAKFDLLKCTIHLFSLVIKYLHLLTAGNEIPCFSKLILQKCLKI